jgi:hypothetical protein
MITSKPIRERERERENLQNLPDPQPFKILQQQTLSSPRTKNNSKPRTPKTKLEAWGLKK